MPKKQGKKKLEGTLEMKVSGSAKFKKYKFWLEWENRKLSYKDVIWKKIDLAETVGWDVTQGEQPRSRRAPRQEEEKRIITLRVWSKRRKKAIDRKLMIPLSDFDTWLYWLLVSIQKHSNIPILEERLEGVELKSSRKGKIRARRDMKAFDTLHRVLITASERLEKDKTLSDKGKMTPRSFRGKTPPPVGQTGEGGIRFSEALELLGHGGQASVFKLNRLRPTGRIEPAAVKSGVTTALVKEARIIAALGEHPNIIRLIDAHAIKEGGGITVRLFMELAEKGDLTKFVQKRQDAKKRLTPVQINIITLGILSGLSHTHKRHIYHLDLKPDNVLMFEHYRPKIMDFGLARTKILGPDKHFYDYNGEGSVGYKPPEFADRSSWGPGVFSNRINLEKYDSYATGIIIFRTLIGPRYSWKYPREDAKDYSKKDALKEIEYWSKKYDNNRKRLDKIGLVMVSTVAWMMIQKDPMHRVTVLDAFESLKGALKERQSGRRALDVIKKWEN
jgi:hypothetical protein